MALPLTVYLGLALVVALLGRRSRAGFIGVFLLSVLFTPLLVGVMVLAFSGSKRDDSAKVAT
jgi:hypothetical protein